MKLIILLFLFASFSSYSQDKDWYDYKHAADKSLNYKTLTRPPSLFSVNENNSRLSVICNSQWGCKGKVKNWKTNPEVRVRMVSWVSEGTIEKFLKPFLRTNKPYNTGVKFLWVTAFPQVQNFCKEIKTNDIRMRLRQFLGVAPDANKTHFVHVWVRPSDLFRPCYDENVSDTTCEYDINKSTSLAHKKWMQEKVKSAFPKTGLKVPWTRLGYTYDWGNPRSYVGASEYVIKANSDVFIEASIPTGIYCSR